MSDHPDAIRRFSHYEAAARQYCEMQGLDPDERLDHGSSEFSDRGAGFYNDMIYYTARWLFIARHLANFEKKQADEQIMESILKLHPPENNGG